MKDVSLKKVTENTYEILVGDCFAGTVQTSCNPFHQQNVYLTLTMKTFEPAVAERAFPLLRASLHKPLQVMLTSTAAERMGFLRAGSFVRKRRCFEMEVSEQQLREPVSAGPLQYAVSGSEPYQTCCRLLYEKYRGTHQEINPLTADFVTFCGRLPELVVYRGKQGAISHYAFLEENEIAYLDTLEKETERSFIGALLSDLFQKYGEITFECDDNDPAAMCLWAFFIEQQQDSFDTYILI